MNLIALPDEWANYKGVLASFGEKFPGIEYPVQNPNASSQEELDAIVNLAGQDDMPDAIDVSPAKAVIATEQGLWQPFEPSTIGEVPDNMKDPDGNWVSAYYGIMSIGTITTIVPNPPKSFADLTKPEYKGLVALNGDPRESGSALAAVMAASIANGGSADDILPGIQFFADLKASGNLIPTEVTQATVISGETPIALDWSYNYPGLAAAVEDAGFEIEINFPSDAAYGAALLHGQSRGLHRARQDHHPAQGPHRQRARDRAERQAGEQGRARVLGPVVHRLAGRHRREARQRAAGRGDGGRM